MIKWAYLNKRTGKIYCRENPIKGRIPLGFTEDDGGSVIVKGTMIADATGGVRLIPQVEIVGGEEKRK